MLFWFWRHMFFPASASGDISAALPSHHSAPPMAADTDASVRALLDNRFLLTLDHEGWVQRVEGVVPHTLDIEPAQLGRISLVSLLHATHRPMFTFPTKTMDASVQRRVQLRHRSGEYGWYSLTYHPHAEGALVVLEPVNNLVEAERNLRKAQVEAEHSMRERGEFLRHMSHELRTPLNAILGFAEMMEQGVFGSIDNEVYSEYLGLIRASGEDLLTKIVDLMDLSAIGAHHVTLQEMEMNLAEVVQAALERLQKVAIDAEITLSAPELLRTVSFKGDARILRKALNHIILNGIEHTGVGGKVEVSLQEREDGSCRLCVQDNGRGIQPSQLKALRHALKDETSLYSHVEAYRPMGLGLTLAKEYLALHGGYVEIETSRPRQGTTVSLVLPAGRIFSSSTPAYAETPHLRLAT